MAGQIKRLIIGILAAKAKENPRLIATTRTKLILKGIDPDNYTLQSEDNPEVISELKNLAKELGVNI